jgi:CheY-like chemotaxis protein
MAPSFLDRGFHVVQFYECDQFLHRAIAEQLAEPLLLREPIVMIARQDTFAGVADRVAVGHDLSPAEVASRMLFVDVDLALRELMDGDMPSRVRFEQIFASIIAQVREENEHGTIWIYGEMVDLLCKSGNYAAALELEELGNALRGRDRLAILCGYALDGFDEDVSADRFREVCRVHTHVNPAEGFTEAPDDRARFEQIALLQQRSRALDRLLARNAPAPALAPASPTAGSSTVYIVDDDASVRQSLARLLGTVDLRVQAFASAEAFIAEVDRTAIGCLILDVQLLGMTGPELQAWMASANWPMPVIAMSASDDAQIEAKALRLGACAFLRKPFEASALFGAIARALSDGVKPGPDGGQTTL